MNGADIEYILNDVPLFGGVLAFDQIPRVWLKRCFIVNTKPVAQAGEHWVLYDNTGSTLRFFDSFGHSPAYYHFTIRRKVEYSTTPLQHPSSDTCGLYCIYYVMCKYKNKSLRQSLSVFSKSKKSNDKYVTTWASRLGRTLSSGQA